MPHPKLNMHSIRKEKKYSLSQVATRCNQSHSNTWKIETNRAKKPGVYFILNVSNMFRVTMRHLIGYESREDSDLITMIRTMDDESKKELHKIVKQMENT